MLAYPRLLLFSSSKKSVTTYSDQYPPSPHNKDKSATRVKLKALVWWQSKAQHKHCKTGIGIWKPAETDAAGAVLLMSVSVRGILEAPHVTMEAIFEHEPGGSFAREAAMPKEGCTWDLQLLNPC